MLNRVKLFSAVNDLSITKSLKIYEAFGAEIHIVPARGERTSEELTSKRPSLFYRVGLGRLVCS